MQDITLANVTERHTDGQAKRRTHRNNSQAVERHADKQAEQTEWNTVNWRQAYQCVSNLRQRIYRASQAGDLKKVRSLQKLMLRSYSNTLVSVRRVTQINAGKKTAGVDKVVVKTPKARGELVDQLMTYQPWIAKPVRRVYIPKSKGQANGKLRPLGIPTVIDRALQARVKNALEPYWEARFEGTSYGFRPGRGCHDAIAKIYLLSCPDRRKKWVVDADIKGAFDNIDHETLLGVIAGFPARALIKQWLKAGYMQGNVFHETEAGTPQGGVISPLLANIALHGMEEALGVTRNKRRGTINGPRAVVRYADDFVVFCESREDAEAAKKTLEEWLKEKGLQLSEEKTRIVHLTEGFDFLGFTIKLYPKQKTNTGYKLLITPSKKSERAIRNKLREAWLHMNGNNVIAVIKELNPIIRGWANYFRIGVASETFSKLDHWMTYREMRYAKRNHPRKSWKWRKNKYWGKLNSSRDNNWVFGDKPTGGYLLRFSWFPIERHTLVRGTASPDDPGLREYWAWREKAKARNLRPRRQTTAWKQRSICPLCGQSLFNGEEIQEHHIQPRSKGGTNVSSNMALVHLYCQRQIHSGRITPKDADGQSLLVLL